MVVGQCVCGAIGVCIAPAEGNLPSSTAQPPRSLRAVSGGVNELACQTGAQAGFLQSPQNIR